MKRFRFNLREVLLFVTLVAVLLSWAFTWRVQRQQLLLQELKMRVLSLEHEILTLERVKGAYFGPTRVVAQKELEEARKRLREFEE